VIIAKNPKKLKKSKKNKNYPFFQKKAKKTYLIVKIITLP
jgi:hypothetical protein